MSILQYPDSFNVPELQVWDNAAFDNGESEDANPLKYSWYNHDSGSVNQSLESDGSKENQSPLWVNSPVSFKSTASAVEPCSRNVAGNPKEPFSVKMKSGVCKEEDKKRDEKKIDMEIEEIEKEVARLSSKLEALRLEKAEYNVRSIAMRGRIVPAKFMEPKQSILEKKMEDPLFSKPKLNRRGVSLLGPSEIFSATKSRQFMKQEFTTPVQSIQSRRKSCFFKLQDIDECKFTRDRGKSLSLSPKSHKTVSKVIAPKPAATTVGAKRGVKKEETVLSTIQPKRLFKDVEKPVTTKNPLKPGRVVSSRYNQIPSQSNGSFKVNDARKQESNKHDQMRVSDEQMVGSCKSESRVKKKWEIPSEVIILKGESPESVDKINDLLPKIRTVRVWGESPRDSGPAKRMAELMGRKSYFSMDEETEDSVCQALSFAEGGGEEV